MGDFVYISDQQVKNYLSWESVLPIIEKALADISKKDGTVIQPPRLIMPVPQKNGVLLSMPSFSNSEDALGCKLVTSFKENQKLGIPTVMGTILLMDSNTGKLKAVVDATEITAWRTAAASAIATKYLCTGQKNILAILGAGAQAKSHAEAFQHAFNFKEVRIWNHNPEKAVKLCEELGSSVFIPYSSNEDCVRGADVICTTTYATTPIVHWDWLKRGVHINAVGGSITHHSELDETTYAKALIIVDSLDAAQKELKGLIEGGKHICGEIGEFLNRAKVLSRAECTVFHSLGMAVEDVLTADYIYKLHMMHVEEKLNQ